MKKGFGGFCFFGMGKSCGKGPFRARDGLKLGLLEPESRHDYLGIKAVKLFIICQCLVFIHPPHGKIANSSNYDWPLLSIGSPTNDAVMHHMGLHD